jgi:hypothetical protein
MKRIAILTYLLLTSVLYISAQEVKWGPEIKKNYRLETFGGVISAGGEGILTHFYIRGKYTLQRFDESLALTQQEEIKIVYNKKELLYEGAMEVDDKVYAFGSFENKKMKRTYLFAQEVNTKTLKLTGTLIKVSEGRSRNREYVGINTEFFNKVHPRNKKRMVIVSEDVAKGEKEAYTISVLDKEMKLQWQKKIVIPYPRYNFDIQEWILGNDGGVYLLGRLYKDKRKGRTSKSDYQYLIIAYTDKGKSVRHHKISKAGHFITDLSFNISDSGKLLCAGFYAAPNRLSIAGTFFKVIDPKTQKVVRQGEKEFSEDFINPHLTGRERKMDEKEKLDYEERDLPKFNMEKVALREDGGATLIAEQFYSREGRGEDRITYTMDFEADIIVINIDSDSTIAWNAKVQRKPSLEGRYSSHASLTTNENKTYIIYNVDTYSSAISLTHATINSGGDVKKKELVRKSDKKGVIYLPSKSQRISNNRIIIYGEHGKKYQLGVISY